MASGTQDSGFVDNWQTGKTVTECNLHMLTTEDCSDVIFRVGSEKHVVQAHRYVLVSRSCVFNAMFCGPLAEKGEVTIPDVKANIFKEFLRYLYTDTAGITAENVTGLMYTSRKYAVDSLLNQCVTFLETSLCEENVCQILEQCHGYGELDLEQKALELLSKAGKKVIKSDGFVSLCSPCLTMFLESCELNLKEEEVFKAALSWSKQRCKDANISPTPENIRKCLGDSRYEIRFTEFSLEYLVNEVGSSGILSRDERMDIMDRSVNSGVDVTPFKTTPRKLRSEFTPQRSSEDSPRKSAWRPQRTSEDSPCNQVLRYTQCRYGWTCKGKPNAVTFSTCRNIQLVGCQLYGPVQSSVSTYSLEITVCDDFHLITGPVPRTERKLRGLGKLNDIILPEPVLLVADRDYSIVVWMTGEKTVYGDGGQTSVTADGVTFNFKDYSTKIPLSRGQIPGLLWK